MLSLTHGPTTRRPRGKRSALAAAVLLGLVAAPAAIAARGGNQQDAPNATCTLGDAATDAVRSDGGGPYDAQMDSTTATVTTGRHRGMAFDFSRVLAEYGEQRAPTGEVSDVTLLLDVAGRAAFEFNASGGRWRLWGFYLSVQAVDVEGDGVVDGFDVADDGTGYYYLVRVLSNGQGQGPRGGPPSEDPVGSYRMPWSATVTAN